jgi:large subunit ribosomal protein L1
MPKKYAEKSALVEKKDYPLDEAVDLLTKVSTSKFDGTAEVHIRLGIDPSQGDQQVRSTVSLPNGTGKDVRIAAIVPEDMVKEVIAAGAVKAGEENMIKDIEKGDLDFDIVVAMPKVMKSLGKVAKTLGQKGLMPNPKAGTVTDDPVKTIKELKKGRVELRADKQAIVHSIFGKLSFGKEKLSENLRTLIQAVQDAKPSGLKSDYIKTITLAPTMGPGVRVEIGSI